MRALVAVVALVLCACGANGFEGGFEVTESYDKFRQVHLRQWKYFALDRSSFDGGGILHMGVAVEGSGAAAVYFESQSKDWRLMRHHDVSLLVDGQPAPVEGEAWSGDVQGGYVSERVYIETSVEQLRGLLDSAKSVEVRVGLDEFAITPKALDSLRAFLRGK